MSLKSTEPPINSINTNCTRASDQQQHRECAFAPASRPEEVEDESDILELLPIEAMEEDDSACVVDGATVLDNTSVLQDSVLDSTALTY